MPEFITPQDLKTRIRSGAELAIIDLRDEGDFIEAHLFHARSVPLSRLKLRIETLVPRRGAPIVLMDGGNAKLVGSGAALLAAMGYTEVLVLERGLEGAMAGGFEKFSGTHVPSKAFGEFVELTYGTPHVSAAELDALVRKGADLVILDARPFDEYHRMNIPSAIPVAGAELVYRIADVVPDSTTTIVVNCAGRTRSIIGAQSLINAGIPNPVFALKDGTAGWQLAGFELERGSDRRIPVASEAGLSRARNAAEAVARRFDVRRITHAELAVWQSEKESRTLYLFDVRAPEEFNAGHPAGFRPAPGGQLVQATDDYVGVIGARIVLADDNGVRATMTASWLMQLGWRDVVVLENALAGPLSQPEARNPGTPDTARPIAEITPLALQALAKSSMAVMVVDLAADEAYCRGHIPGSVWATPQTLNNLLGDFSNLDVLVIAAEDDAVAHAVARSLVPLTTHAVLRVLIGGAAGWADARLPVNTIAPGALRAPDSGGASSPEQKAAIERELRKYLTWEVGLVEQVRRDGDAGYRYFV